MTIPTVQNICDISNTALTDVKLIPLTQGKFCVVDAEDYNYLSQWRWSCSHWGYAVRLEYLGKIDGKYKRKGVFIHRVITEAEEGREVDHINNERLDNRRCNLRVVGRWQNEANKPKCSVKTSSKYKGVTWQKGLNKWKAQIMVNKVNYHLGVFRNEVAAAQAYNTAALKHFGEYAKINLGV